jgi:hypothetical protein
MNSPPAWTLIQDTQMGSVGQQLIGMSKVCFGGHGETSSDVRRELCQRDDGSK